MHPNQSLKLTLKQRREFTVVVFRKSRNRIYVFSNQQIFNKRAKRFTQLSSSPLERIISICVMKLSLYLSILPLLIIGCSSIQVLPDYVKIEKVLTKRVNTANIIYYMSEDDSIQGSRNEQFYLWLSTKLKNGINDKIIYYKYKDVEQKYQLMGAKGNAVVIDDRVHTISSYDNHELVHVLVGKYYGNPPKMFTEGIAVAHQTNPAENDFVPKWGVKPIDSIALELSIQSKIPNFDSLLVFGQFFRYPESISYPVSGSYVSYLLSNYGYDNLWLFVTKCNWTESVPELKKIFKEVYQKDIELTWIEWKKHLNSKSNL